MSTGAENLTHMGQRTTRVKLMGDLSAQAQRLGRAAFTIPFSRQQLADYLAVERSGLCVELEKMQKDGLWDSHKNHFVPKTQSGSVQDFEKLCMQKEQPAL